MRSSFAFILFIFSVSCSENNSLHKACVKFGNPCIVVNNEIILSSIEDYTNNSVCSAGTISCDENGDMICLDYVGPSEEECDFTDNDCDGQVDEDFDKDLDGFTACGGDCNDQNKNINPNSPETCDGIDNNCDNIVDRLEQECWLGGSETNKDNPLTECRSGTKKCLNGAWTSCLNQSFGSAEICDGIDNDCDGQIDEREIRVCGPFPEVGACRLGDFVCTSEDDQICVNAVYQSVEVCDGIDNDCDGTVDEDLNRPCQTNCGTGVEFCNNGVWGSCSAPIPSVEVCDGIDNDCDGEIDEICECNTGEVRVCRGGILFNPVTSSTISCGVGVALCEHGEWGECIYVGNDTGETCNNWDDDCDGIIDEIVTSCGDPNLAGIGECRIGTSTCTEGVWSTCGGEILPTAEICDEKDNDCDGEVDEGLNPRDKVDLIFAIDGSGSMCNVMNALRQGISTYVNDFQGTEHRFGIIMFPGIHLGETSITLTTPPLTDIVSFQNVLNGIQCNYGGTEPSYDVLFDIASPVNTLNINWRSDAYPYIILITDEYAQSINNTNESMVAMRTRNCNIGSCAPGDTFEVFVITHGSFFIQWDEPTFFDPNRTIEIFPADGTRYTSMLRSVFSNICI